MSEGDYQDYIEDEEYDNQQYSDQSDDYDYNYYGDEEQQ